jgi:serine/threonine-protein kinase RsbW
MTSDPESASPARDLSRSSLTALRTLATDAARAAGLDSDQVNRLAMVVDEAMTNAIRHAGGGSLRIVRSSGAGVTVEIRDHGPGIPPGTPVVMPSPQAVGGRGLPLIHLLSDRVEIHSGPAGTTVRLTVGPGLRH